jgi:hypothetical protein
VFLASGGQGALLKNRPLDPHKTFYYLCLDMFKIFCENLIEMKIKGELDGD